MEGRGRLVTAADSQPSSMRVDENRTSTGCHTPLMPESLIFNRASQVFITFTLYTQLPCQIQLLVTRLQQSQAAAKGTPFFQHGGFSDAAISSLHWGTHAP